MYMSDILLIISKYKVFDKVIKSSQQAYIVIDQFLIVINIDPIRFFSHSV
jgi:hypothetical protein